VLDELIDMLGAKDIQTETHPLELCDAPTGSLDANSAAMAIAHYLPENAVIVDEAITSGIAVAPLTATARRHDWLNQTGGSIGWGLPAAVGAAIACPARKVVCLEGDGSAMYTLQSLWTQARDGLDVTTVIFANRDYAILKGELANVGAHNPGHKALDMLEIGRPDLDWVAMARGMGVDAARVHSAEEFCRAVRNGIAVEGPYLIEVVL